MSTIRRTWLYLVILGYAATSRAVLSQGRVCVALTPRNNPHGVIFICFIFILVVLTLDGEGVLDSGIKLWVILDR